MEEELIIGYVTANVTGDFKVERGYRTLSLNDLEIKQIRESSKKGRPEPIFPNIDDWSEVNLLVDSYEEYLNGRDERPNEHLLIENKKLSEYLKFLLGKLISIRKTKKVKISKVEETIWKMIYYQRHYPTVYGRNSLKRIESLYPEESKKIRHEINEFKKRQGATKSTFRVEQD